MTFAERVRELRHRLGLTQEQMAGRLHVDTTTLRRWELGRSKPTTYAPEAALSYLEHEERGGETISPQTFREGAHAAIDRYRRAGMIVDALFWARVIGCYEAEIGKARG